MIIEKFCGYCNENKEISEDDFEGYVVFLSGSNMDVNMNINCPDCHNEIAHFSRSVSPDEFQPYR